MNLNSLEYLTAIAEEGNLTRAAKKLYVSQPALTKALASMEQKLGVTLMERRRDCMALTPEGRVYLEAARKMLAVKSETEEKISQIAHNKIYPPVRIGINNSASIARMMSLMVNQMQTEMPIFFDVDSVECVEMLRKGQLDICSLSLPDGIPDDFKVIKTIPGSLMIAVPATPEFDYLNMNYTDTIPIQALNGAKAVQCRPQSGLGITCARYLAEHQVSLNYVCAITVLSAVMLAVARGTGLTLIHDSFASGNSAYKTYVPDPPVHYVHSLCIRKGAEITPKMRRVLKILWDLEL